MANEPKRSGTSGSVLRIVPRRSGSGGLIRLEEALDALGDAGAMGNYHADVAIPQIIGTMARARDFDEQFRPRRRDLKRRWHHVADAVDSAVDLPPVQLIRLGDLYFVVDGHHRVSVARALGWTMIPACVHRICTVAYAMACLRLAHLPNKAAERQFLQRVPLADDVREELWLDEPAYWPRLADAAEAWAFRETLEHRVLVDRRELAEAWWREEVVPLVRRLRETGAGAGLRDVQLYANALALRDRRDTAAWPTDPAHPLNQWMALPPRSADRDIVHSCNN